jgi:hypothetical protein
MKKSTFVIMILFITWNTSWGVQDENLFIDGHNWEQMGDAATRWIAKVCYLKGLAEGSGAKLIAVYDGFSKEYKGDYARAISKVDSLISNNRYDCDLSNTTLDQVMEGIDEIYKDYANKHIPVFAIATLVTQRITGKIKEEDIPQKLEELRSIKWLTK